MATEHEQWNELVRDWTIKNKLSQAASADVTRKMDELYRGVPGAANPTAADMETAEQLRAAERLARKAMDDFIAARAK